MNVLARKKHGFKYFYVFEIILGSNYTNTFLQYVQ